MSTQPHLDYCQHCPFIPSLGHLLSSDSDGFSSHPDFQSLIHSLVLSGMPQAFPYCPKHIWSYLLTISSCLPWLLVQFSCSSWHHRCSALWVFFYYFSTSVPTHTSSQKQTGGLLEIKDWAFSHSHPASCRASYPHTCAGRRGSGLESKYPKSCLDLIKNSLNIHFHPL